MVAPMFVVGLVTTIVALNGAIQFVLVLADAGGNGVAGLVMTFVAMALGAVTYGLVKKYRKVGPRIPLNGNRC